MPKTKFYFKIVFLLQLFLSLLSSVLYLLLPSCFVLSLSLSLSLKPRIHDSEYCISILTLSIFFFYLALSSLSLFFSLLSHKLEQLCQWSSHQSRGVVVVCCCGGMSSLSCYCWSEEIGPLLVLVNIGQYRPKSKIQPKCISHSLKEKQVYIFI